MTANLYVVGFPKAATTSLYSVLSESREIYAPSLKEPHFHAADIRSDCVSLHGTLRPFFPVVTREDYEDLYVRASQQRYRLDGSTSYIYSERAADLIAEDCPEARIIVVLRHPAEQIHSWYEYLCNTREESSHSFESAVFARRLDEVSSTTHPYLRSPRRIDYLGVQICYETALRRYYEKFGRSQVLVLFFENLVAEPRFEISKIESFLAVELPKQLPVANSHWVSKLPWLRRIVDRSSSLSSFRRSEAWQRMRSHALFSGVFATLNKSASRRQLSPETTERIVREFRQRNPHLEELIGGDYREVWQIR